MRIGVTGLARAGKTAFLTSVAANLLASATATGAGLAALPALAARLGGRGVRVARAPAGASAMPRFDIDRHVAALAADPPRWPERTDAVSLLALDLDIDRAGVAGMLPPRRLRLEFLDYPGEWLLDLPLLRQDFAQWSAAALRRLEGRAEARAFLAFAHGLPRAAPAEESLAATGHALYRAALHRLRDEARLSFLQPGRFLMPPPGPEPPWMGFFPMAGDGGLASLLRARYDAYRAAVRRELADPLFAAPDRLVVLADLLGALHAGEVAFADAAAALSAVAGGLGWSRLPALLAGLGLPAWLAGGIRRIAFAATKADHVAERQRANLAALMRGLVAGSDAGAAFAISSVRCTEDFVWSLDGRNVSAVRGRQIGQGVLTRSYPGEVPHAAPEPGFWAHAFLALPEFEPLRPPEGGRAGVPQLGLDRLLAWLLEDVL